MPSLASSGSGGSSLHPFLGVALAAALAQLASGDPAPYVAPDSLVPFGTADCGELWRAVMGDCNPCMTLARFVALLLPDVPLLCPQ